MLTWSRRARPQALPAEIASQYSFAIMDRGASLHPWLDERFERTTIDGQFYGQGDKFYAWTKDFSLVISEVRTRKNWASNELGGVLPDKLQLTSLQPLFERVASGKEKALAQGDAAAPAAGLKEMNMGFGPGGGGGLKEVPDPAHRSKAKKKAKKAKKAKAEKAEL